MVGLAAVVMAMMLRGFTARPLLPPSARATEEQRAESRRSQLEIQTWLVPWMRRLGVAAMLVGLVLVLIDLIL